MNENEILGFDPTSLSVFNQEETSKKQFNSNLYRMRPSEAKSDDGVYRATIKVIYNPFDLRQSILEQQSYGLQDAQGWFTVVSSLTINDLNCPIFKAWKKCHYAEKGSALWKQAASVAEGGNGLFDKRFGRYVTIQVISDKNHPELEGKYMLWKMPRSIWDVINAKMNPAAESMKAPIPVMDFLFGRALDIEVIPGPKDPAHPEREARETKYMCELTDDVVSCVNPDGSPLLNDSEQDILDEYVRQMSKVWRSRSAEERAQLTAEINANENTKQLRTLYARVLEEIKKVCPDLNKELSYHEWSDDVKERVQRWIDIVLEGNVPAASGQAPEAAKTVDTPVTSTVETTTAAAPAAQDNDDDLPF